MSVNNKKIVGYLRINSYLILPMPAPFPFLARFGGLKSVAISRIIVVLWKEITRAWSPKTVSYK